MNNEKKQKQQQQQQQNGKDWRSFQENWRHQGNISCTDVHSQGQDGKDLREAEEIKNTWEEDTEELYKKGLNDMDNHDGLVTQLESEILECEGKWALWSVTSVMSDSLRPHGLWPTRLLCP